MRRMTITLEVLESEVAQLRDLSQNQIAHRWRLLTRCPPPTGLKGELLRAVLAHRLQEQALGAMSKGLERRLADQAREQGRSAVGPSQPTPVRRLKPGTRLLRSWQGVTQEVVVTREGYLWEGQVHPSLSAIARAITGVSWNGWRFFGLLGSKCPDQEHQALEGVARSSLKLEASFKGEARHG